MAKKSKCLLCQSEDFLEFWRIADYNFCWSCHSARLKKISKTRYEKEYYEGRSGIASKIFAPIVQILYLTRNLYSGFDQKQVFIDVGAGDGQYLQRVSVLKK